LASGLESGGNMWNYRIVKIGNEISIKEVFYEKGKPIMYGPSSLSVDLDLEEPVENEACHIATMLVCMTGALHKPILNEDDFPTETIH